MRTVRRVLTFGHRLPLVIGALIVAIASSSIIGAIALQLHAPFVEYGLLVPGLVWQGQVWRLVTWAFFELQPFNLLFACAMLYWFARDLLAEWGDARFLRVYFGLAMASGIVVSLIARFAWHGLLAEPYTGGFAVASSMAIAWALTFPERQIYLYFVARVGGMVLIYATFGITLIFAVFYGPAVVLHSFVADLLMLGYMYRHLVTRRIRAQFTAKPKARKSKSSSDADLRVWDEKKQEFRKPKWMN